MNRFRVWIITFFCTVMIGLGWQTNAPAETIPPPSYMMGYYDPSEPAGYVTFADGAPSALHSTVLDSQYSGEVVRLINLKRTSAGLFPLMVSPVLTGVA